MDYRQAADILTRFAEDIRPDRNHDTGALPPPLSRQGLSARPHSLDAALTRLHMSPFPALVIEVEGETEYRLVPRVMDMLGITCPPQHPYCRSAAVSTSVDRLWCLAARRLRRPQFRSTARILWFGSRLIRAPPRRPPERRNRVQRIPGLAGFFVLFGLLRTSQFPAAVCHSR
jgi:hypothetical protein